MANVLVYLQRTPHGLHPASLIATCVARDLASARGATVTGLCVGDGGEFDEHVVTAVSRAGADVLVFAGDSGLRHLYERLRPRFVLIPWTHDAHAAVEAANLGPAVPRWVGGPQDDPDALDHVTAMVAGALPWHTMPDVLDPEYGGEVGDTKLPQWLEASGGKLHSDERVVYVAPPDLDADVRQRLQNFGAEPVAPDYAERHVSGTLLWLDAGPNGLPEALGQRPEHARVILMPGPAGEPTDSWSISDWVLPGDWAAVMDRLSSEGWRKALT